MRNPCASHSNVVPRINAEREDHRGTLLPDGESGDGKSFQNMIGKLNDILQNVLQGKQQNEIVLDIISEMKRDVSELKRMQGIRADGGRGGSAPYACDEGFGRTCGTSAVKSDTTVGLHRNLDDLTERLRQVTASIGALQSAVGTPCEVVLASIDRCFMERLAPVSDSIHLIQTSLRSRESPGLSGASSASAAPDVIAGLLAKGLQPVHDSIRYLATVMETLPMRTEDGRSTHIARLEGEPILPVEL